LLTPGCAAKKKEFDFYFEELEIKNRGSMGNQVTHYPIKSVKFKEAGQAAHGGKKLWFDDQFGRLNTEEKGQYLGSFAAEDKVLSFFKDGSYQITDQELTQRIDPEKVLRVEKFNPEKTVTAVYLDKEKLQFNIKRFKIETTTLQNRFSFIKEGEGNYLEAVSTDEEPILVVTRGRGAQINKAKFKVVKLVEVTGWKTVGTKLVDFSKSIVMEWDKKSADKNAPELFE